MRIIEESDKTTLPELEFPEPDEPKEKSNDESKGSKTWLQKEMFNIAKEIHELGNKLMDVASKL